MREKWLAIILILPLFYVHAADLENDEEYDKAMFELIKGNYSSAKKTWSKLADHNHAPSVVKLGDLYHYGIGVDRDSEIAMRWYKRALDLKETRVLNDIGLLYWEEKEYQKALRWFKEAAEHNNAYSYYMIGNMYLLGKGVPKDQKLATDWHQKAANLNLPRSQYNIGVSYFKGRGVEKDLDIARQYFEKAAYANYPKAFFNLGIIYIKSKKSKENISEAYIWFSIAAVFNISKSAQIASDLKNIMTEYEQLEANNIMKSRLEKISKNAIERFKNRLFITEEAKKSVSLTDLGNIEKLLSVMTK